MSYFKSFETHTQPIHTRGLGPIYFEMLVYLSNYRRKINCKKQKIPLFVTASNLGEESPPKDNLETVDNLDIWFLQSFLLYSTQSAPIPKDN